MSCDWNIRCVTCNSTHEFQDANHCLNLMLILIKHAKVIGALDELMQDDTTWADIDLITQYGRIDTGWFKTHCEHELRAIDEYGRLHT